MLAYLATKERFLQDAPRIEDIVRDEVKRKLNLNVGKSEYQAWQNSLGNAMFHAMDTPLIPDDAGVAIEYRLNGRRFRIDFMISGRNSKDKESVVIVELKQWTDIQFSDLAEHVKTYLGGRLSDERHPSYQAWSYLTHLQLFNEYVYEKKLDMSACAYLHNCLDGAVVGNSRYENELRRAPVFLKGDIAGLRQHIKSHIAQGTGTSLLERIDAAAIRPSRQLADAVAGMLDGKEEFVLIDNQKTVLEKIVRASTKSLKGAKQVMIVNGGPGTGKSVISINALARLTAQRLNARYVTPNAAPRTVYESKLKNVITGDAFKHLFSGSGSFIEPQKNAFDALIVDESHRLTAKSGFMKNLGENQIKEIIHSARTSVFFIDEAQKVTWADIGEISEIEKFAIQAGAEIEHLTLQSQFRCGGSDDYMAWLDNILEVRPGADQFFSQKRFDFKIVDSPVELHKLIKEKNRINNKSRLVAGYCWNWISKKNPKLFDIEFPQWNFKMRWNLTTYGNAWIIDPNSINEVGCIHTCQGLEVDYIGVIIGPDLRVRDNHLITDPSVRAKTDKSLKGFKKEFKIDPVAAELKADEIIRNTYRTLMSRGMKGCYVYFTDESTAKYFKDRLPDKL
jgi:DUF2075 family protein